MSSPLTSMDMKRIFDNRSISYVYLACYVAFAYDILLCLSNEIALMWGSRWSLIKFLFFATQYPLLFELILVLYYTLSAKLPHQFCVTTSYILIWDFSFPFFPSQVVFIQRTYAICNRSRWVLVVLSSVAIIWDILIIQSSARDSSAPSVSPPQSSGDFGCSVFHPGSTTLNRLLPAFVAGLTFDSIVFGLTFSRVMRYARSKSTPLLEILFRDGLLYYAILCCSGLAFVILVVTLPAANVNVVGAFAFFIRTITATCVSRIVLNLRSLRPRESSSNEDSDYASKGGSGGEDIQFALTTFRTTVQTVQPRLL